MLRLQNLVSLLINYVVVILIVIAAGMITLPGGAVLVAKSGSTAEDTDQATAGSVSRASEPPDVSITLSNKTQETMVTSPPAAAPAHGVPPPLLSTLDSMELPLALLPTLLAVYRDVRDTYKLLVVQGYCVSWSTLLMMRLKSAWPGTIVTTDSVDQLVSQTLTAAGHTQILRKTVTRPGPVLTSVTLDLMRMIQEHCDRWERQALSAWKHWSPPDQESGELSARQFVSLCQFLSPQHEVYSWDDVMWTADLCDVWSRLSGDTEDSLDNNDNVRAWRRVVSSRSEDNISFSRVSRWNSKVHRISVHHPLVSRRPRIVTKNLRLFWSQERIRMLKQANKTAFSRWRYSRNRRYHQLREMIVSEFRKMIGVGHNLLSSQILGKLAQVQRREKSGLVQSENREWSRLVLEYKQFLVTEAEVETVEETVDDHEERLEDDIKTETGLDYNNDDTVLQYIRDKEAGKKIPSANVWSSSSLQLLLKARSTSKKRRESWERWAVAKYGSLTAAVSNPRLKVPKIEELLVEEWSKMKPNQSGISAWTLNNHLKKFDALKKQLVDEQEEERRQEELRRAPPVRVLCHPNTDIPIYNLEELLQHPKLPANVKMLIDTRQRSLSRPERSKLRYLEQWSQVWSSETGEKIPGWRLQQRLTQLLTKPSIRNKLRRFVQKFSPEPDQLISDQETVVETSAPAVGGRVEMFPRVNNTVTDTLIRRKHEYLDMLDYDEENLVELLGSGKLGLPVVLGVDDIIEEEGLRLRPKISYIHPPHSSPDTQPPPDDDQEKIYTCTTPHNTQLHFTNYNNYQYYLQLHKIPASQEKPCQTFGAMLASQRICGSIVSEIVSQVALHK